MPLPSDNRDFTDGELELVTGVVTTAIAKLAGVPDPGETRRSRHGSILNEFDFSDYGGYHSETLLGFRDDDPRIDEQLTYARSVLDRLLRERDRRRAVTLQRVCEWAEFGLPRISQ